MRVALLSILFAVAGVILPVSAQALATSYQLNIPRQPLDAALKDLAQQTGTQIARFSDAPGGPALVVGPVSGDMSVVQALTALLKTTGLTYRVVNDRTIAVVIPGAGSAVSPQSTNRDASQLSTYSSDARNGEEAKRSFWDRFRLVQVDQGASSGTTPVEKEKQGQRPSEKQPVQLEEVLVTAQKREERLLNVPISISVLSGSDLDKSTVQGVGEALNAVPGVATTSNYLGGGTTVTIRGVSAAFPTLVGSSAVAYYLDSAPFGLVRSAIAPDSNAYDLQRVEVLRGPQGTLYGASALNGVVRVLSNDADLSNFDVKARVSDSGTKDGGNNYRGDVAVNVPIIADKLAVRAVLGYEKDGGWIDQPNKNDVNDRELRTYRLKVNAQPTQDLSIGLSAWSSHNNADAPSFGYTFDKTSSVLDQPIFTDYDVYGLKVGYGFSGISVTSLTSYLDYSNGGSLGLDIPAFSLPGTIFFSGTKSNIFSQEVLLNSTPEGKWRWSVGGMYRSGTENIHQYYTAILAFIPVLQYDTESKSYALFGEVTRRFLEDRLELTAGLRHFHDKVSQLDQTGVGAPFIPAGSVAEANTPRGVLTWHATDHLMVYTSYSQGFRSGFPQSEAVLLGFPTFPPVRPDRLRNYEGGSKGTFLDGRVGYDSSVYYMKWQDIQQQLTVPFAGSPGVVAVVNGQAASGVGADFALFVEPVKDLTLRASVSWNNLQFDRDVISGGIVLFNKGDRPNASPKTTAGASAEYRFALGGTGYSGRIAASVNYTSSQYYRSPGVSGSATTVVTQVSDPIVLSRTGLSVDSPNKWTATLFADNVNNEHGAAIKSFPGVPDWYGRVRPRTVGVQVDVHFK